MPACHNYNQANYFTIFSDNHCSRLFMNAISHFYLFLYYWYVFPSFIHSHTHIKSSASAYNRHTLKYCSMINKTTTIKSACLTKPKSDPIVTTRVWCKTMSDTHCNSYCSPKTYTKQKSIKTNSDSVLTKCDCFWANISHHLNKNTPKYILSKKKYSWRLVKWYCVAFHQTRNSMEQKLEK